MAGFSSVTGLFLISHSNDDKVLCDVAKEIKVEYPRLKVGINLLQSRSPEDTVMKALDSGLDMVWFDFLGVTSESTGTDAIIISSFIKDTPIEIYCGVAFKYQKVDHHPEIAAEHARHLGFIPTTTGLATGSAPSIEKIKKMSNGPLAIASGITPKNVAQFVPHVTHLLVATGISKDFNRVDPQKLDQLILNVNFS